MTLSPLEAGGRLAPTIPAERMQIAAMNPAAPPAADLLDVETWDVVRDDQGRAVRPLSRPAAGDAPAAEGHSPPCRPAVHACMPLTRRRGRRGLAHRASSRSTFSMR